MSEYFFGNLILKKHVNLLSKIETDEVIIREAGDIWTVFYTKFDMEDEVSPIIMNFSNLVPILKYSYHEDSGWEYQILHQNKVVSNFSMEISLGYDLVFDLLSEKYPQFDDIIEALHQNSIINEELTYMIENIKDNELYIDAIDNLFLGVNIDSFSLFELKNDLLESLKQILNKESYLQDDFSLALNEKFKEILNIEGVEWSNYDSVS